ncbi:hypothetical protein BPOR_1119g00020 [Botrytis porri]|uniref:Uncharacterized protein n=1 Tax=Botrytis porri TaxID=87229 RepID=A0A4Z1K7U3_9HELO|nr:hypothetical protein BPOR_1119g00020 [Botrytis porri]
MLLNHAQRTGCIIDINAQDSDGMTPLHFACISGRPETVSILISAGANIEIKTRQETSGTTPLMACAMFLEEDSIWKLLQKWKLTKLDAEDPFRVLSSPSGTMGPESKLNKATQHIACHAGETSAHLPWYEEHSADFKAKNNEGEGALHIVAKQEHFSRTPSSFSGEDEKVKAKRHWFGVLVKKYGCEVLDEDSKGRTALDIAAAVETMRF